MQIHPLAHHVHFADELEIGYFEERIDFSVAMNLVAGVDGYKGLTHHLGELVLSLATAGEEMDEVGVVDQICREIEGEGAKRYQIRS